MGEERACITDRAKAEIKTALSKHLQKCIDPKAQQGLLSRHFSVDTMHAVAYEYKMIKILVSIGGCADNIHKYCNVI